MKRDFLEKLGLGKAAIDAVMAEHGKTVEELRLRNEAKEKEAEEAASALSALAAEKEALSKTLSEKTEAFHSFRSRVIASAVAEAMPSSTLAKKELIRCLNEAADRGEEPQSVLRRLKASDPDAFQSGHTLLPVFAAVSLPQPEEFPPISPSLRRR